MKYPVGRAIAYLTLVFNYGKQATTPSCLSDNNINISFATNVFAVHCICILSGSLTYGGKCECVALLNKENVKYTAVARYLCLCEYSNKTVILPNLHIKASVDIELSRSYIS